MRRTALLLLLLLAQTACQTARTLDGHAVEDVWLAAKEVMLERDSRTMFDRGRYTAWSDDRESRWYDHLISFVTLGAFGTTGESFRVELTPDGDRVEVAALCQYEFLAGFFPVFWSGSQAENELLSAIEARLAQRKPLGGVPRQLERLGAAGAPEARSGKLSGWDEQDQRERLFARRLAEGQRRPVQPRRTDPRPERASQLQKPIDPPPAGMVLIPGGEYAIGDEKGEEDARPVRTVTLDPYYIDRHEVTNAEYRKFVEWFRETKDGRFAHPDQPPGKDHVPATWKSPDYRRFTGDDQPVVGIDWYDAYAYARWAGKRLPTEAEWEAAARGKNARAFPWGPHFAVRLANTRDAGAKRTMPIGSYPGGNTPEGIADLGGNAWEWCYDWYEPDYYAKAPTANPQGPAIGKDKVIRGGSWAHPSKMARGSYRNFGRPVVWSYYIGFRCAKSAR